MNNIIEVRNLSFTYPSTEVPALGAVNLVINKGDIVQLEGQNGCGKSTLCLALCGLIPHSVKGKMIGSVSFWGEDGNNLPLSGIVQKVGVVFQDPNMQLFLPSVRAELAFAPENLGLPKDEIEKRISQVAHRLQLADILNANPRHLSGGQQTLVTVASVLTMQPKVLILDEVFAGLDVANKHILLDVIKQWQAQGGTIILVDHGKNARPLVTRYIHMSSGRIIEES